MKIIQKKDKLFIEVPIVLRIPVFIVPFDGKASVTLQLTNREKQVLDGIKRGLLNKQIADELHISTRTAAFHVTNVMRRFGVMSRKELQKITEEIRSE